MSAADRSKESASELGPDFEVIRRLPGGTVAEVFLVRPAAGGAPLVMKVVRKGLTQDQDVVARFLDEVRALQGLAHPYIIRQLGTGRLKDDRLYLLTEALEGEDLQAHLHAQGPVGPDDAVRLLLPLCDALDHVHRRGLVHRDLKPDNVFLAGGLYQFSPRLLDFGLAFFEGQRHAQTVTGLVVGTPEFTAPECVAGQRADARSDLYALGALLYNMLTGSPPFLAPRPDQLFQKVLHDPVPALPPPCAWLDPVVQRLTAKSPEDRYGSAAEVADALRRVARRPGTLPIPLSEPALQLEQVGDVVGNFELTQLLGEGSMGRVFQARHTRLGRQVALKVLRPEHVRTPDLVQRFFQEARTVNQINHEHIVEIIDFVAESGADGVPHAYCVMELLVGHSLADTLRKEPLLLRRTASIMAQVCEALAVAHETGVVHRDVKPDNIFLVERSGVRDYVKVLDFGVAKLLRAVGDLPAGGTAHGAVIGTPTYMPPEQASGLGAEERSDIYSVGVVLYEALTGKVPFEGQNFGQLVVQIVTQPPAPLPAQTPSGEPVPPGLAALVLRCLAKDPAERPASMRELAAALAPYAREGWQEPAARPPRRQRPAMRAAAALLGVAGLGWAVRPSAPLPVPLPPLAVVPRAPLLQVPAPPPPPPAPAPTVVLSVNSVPPLVRVTRLDTHELLGETPLKRTLERSGEVVLRFERDGFTAVERAVQLDSNAFLDIALVAAPAAAAPRAKPKQTTKVTHDGVIDDFPE